MSTALAERPASIAYTGNLITADKLAALEEMAASQVNILAHPNRGAIFAPAFQMAEAISSMRSLLTDDVMKPIMKLQGSRLGFRTDKDKERNKEGGFGYPLEVVRDCLIEAVLVGGRPSGNEMNIIAGNCYLTKEYFTRFVREFPGLTDLTLEYSPPVNGPYGAMVDCKASWKRDGRPDSLSCQKTDIGDNRICVRVNAGMQADAIFGKAERKLLAKIWRKLTGSNQTLDGDVDEHTTGNMPPRRTLEVPPENGPKTNGSKSTPPPDSGPPTRNPYNEERFSKYLDEIEAASDQKALRRINAAAIKSSQSGEIYPDEYTKIQGHLQERKNQLPAE